MGFWLGTRGQRRRRATVAYDADEPPSAPPTATATTDSARPLSGDHRPSALRPDEHHRHHDEHATCPSTSAPIDHDDERAVATTDGRRAEDLRRG
jgi:hypothetical protein